MTYFQGGGGGGGGGNTVIIICLPSEKGSTLKRGEILSSVDMVSFDAVLLYEHACNAGSFHFYT